MSAECQLVPQAVMTMLSPLFVNSVIVPGLTYGWAPEGMDALVYAAPRDGKIHILEKDLRGPERIIAPLVRSGLTKVRY